MKTFLLLLTAIAMLVGLFTGATDRVEAAMHAKVDTAVSSMVEMVSAPMLAHEAAADELTDELDRIEGITE